MIQTASEFISKYFDIAEGVINQDIDLISFVNHSADPFIYSYTCHEATLAFAYALNKTIAGKYIRSIAYEFVNDSYNIISHRSK